MASTQEQQRLETGGLYNRQAFFGRFSAIKIKSSWQNLEFFKKFLEFIQKNGISFPKFPEFSQFQALKLKFGQIFVQNISTSGLF